jgi:ergothioneine biosynthesis protein EgtB
MTTGEASTPALAARNDRSAPLSLFSATRETSRALIAHLTPEDMVIQAMPDASPTRWHLAHTTWFFEEFILRRFEKSFTPHHEAYGYLFNSYYEGAGERWARSDRGLLSRPTTDDILDYREAVEERVTALLPRLEGDELAEAERLVVLGCHHEQQHQELLCTDIKAALAMNPLDVAAFPPSGYRPLREAPGESVWAEGEGGLVSIGHAGEAFAFDNEGPEHEVFLQPYALQARPVTNSEYCAFIEDGGYETASLWLYDGWDWLQREGRSLPQYWSREDGTYCVFTLHGAEVVADNDPVCHLSAYEAFAYAQWAGARLPKEAELEQFLQTEEPHDELFLNPGGRLHPQRQERDSFYGQVWSWTQSAYAGYPGYRPPSGTIGEYNGKFMSSQLVLKGGSCLTPKGHIRPSYRNFFPPHATWQMTGLRLARDL